MIIVGRKKEQAVLAKSYLSNEAEFIIVYGRRRVGKTYLIREYFKAKGCILFHATGLQHGTLKKQLKKFAEALSETFFDGASLKTPQAWDEALQLLHQQISKKHGHRTKKIVVFLDELPWMATRKSGLLQEIDYYWNHYWSAMNQVILVVCGSSASWLIQKIIYNKGGLHNRLTREIKLHPFTLVETSAFLKHNKIKLNQDHILSLYMAVGGIPYYLKYIEPGLTSEQNIQKLFFGKEAILKDEFTKLFHSLFEKAEIYIELIEIISQKREGVSRSELDIQAKLSTTGGSLSNRLQELADAGFIEEYKSIGKTKGEYYKLIDEFCLFYLYWVAPNKSKKITSDYWLHFSLKPSFYAWSGYAFEAVCHKHIEQIIHALNIRTGASIGSWRYTPRKRKEEGAQIDLIIDRLDNALHLCEIKYTKDPFIIDKEYAKKIQRKIEIFVKKTSTKKQIFFSIISAHGIKETLYSNELIDGMVTLTDLYKA